MTMARATVLGGGIALLLGFALWFSTANSRMKNEHKEASIVPLVMALVFAAFASNLILASTVKYQAWAHQRMWPYYYSGMSYLAWVALISVGVSEMARFARSHAWLLTGRIAVVLTLSLAALSVEGANRQAIALLSSRRFDHIESYRASFPDCREMPRAR